MKPDVVILWYWSYGVLYFDIADPEDWFEDWYYIDQEGNCAKAYVEINGKLVNPKSIPEYVAYVEEQKKEKENDSCIYSYKSSDFTLCDVESLIGRKAKVSLDKEDLIKYQEIFGERLTIRSR